MRYKVYTIDNRDNTLRTLDPAKIYTYADVQRMIGVIDLEDGILQREGRGLYIIPETYLYFNLDIMKSAIHTIPSTTARIRFLMLTKQVGTAFYRYIKSITPRTPTNK
jgi:hypothetical protein